MNVLIALYFLINNIMVQSVHAPELVRGQAVCVGAPLRACYINGGDWQAVQIGKRVGDIETGVFVRVSGANIDNDNMPVSYRVEWKNEHKYDGFIVYRGHERKLCAANREENLSCR